MTKARPKDTDSMESSVQLKAISEEGLSPEVLREGQLCKECFLPHSAQILKYLEEVILEPSSWSGSLVLWVFTRWKHILLPDLSIQLLHTWHQPMVLPVVLSLRVATALLFPCIILCSPFFLSRNTPPQPWDLDDKFHEHCWLLMCTSQLTHTGYFFLKCLYWLTRPNKQIT